MREEICTSIEMEERSRNMEDIGSFKKIGKLLQGFVPHLSWDHSAHFTRSVSL